MLKSSSAVVLWLEICIIMFLSNCCCHRGGKCICINSTSLALSLFPSSQISSVYVREGSRRLGPADIGASSKCPIGRGSCILTPISDCLPAVDLVCVFSVGYPELPREPKYGRREGRQAMTRPTLTSRELQRTAKD